MVSKDIKNKYITTIFVVVGIFTIPLYIITPYLIYFFVNPQDNILLSVLFPTYIGSDFQVLILCILFYTASVLLGYVFYLITTASTRAELIAGRITKDLLNDKFKLEELYENSPVPYLNLNKEGEIHGCNKATLRFFGALPEELSGKSFFVFTAVEDVVAGDKFLNFFKSGVPINREEIRLVTKNEGTKWASISIFLTTDSVTKEKTGLVTVVDITEQKQLDQAKTEFVSLASHQLRTPLVTVKWYAEMLMSNQLGELNEKQREYLNKMYSVNTGMIDLVEVLLNVSRIEIGTLAIAKQPTNVPEIIDGILVELASQIDKKKIVFRKNYNDVLNSINTDPRLLRIIIQNLITNAIKYNKDGGSVTITLDEKIAAGQSSISVSDTGLGIPKEDQAHIFSKLFRAANVRDISNSQSTGLGLYLVKSVAGALGGSIDFVSEENAGSTFTLRL
jgi:PAS domain S-box-containing protein